MLTKNVCTCILSHKGTKGSCVTFYLAYMKIQKTTVALTLASVLASHFKVLCQSFYVIGKALSGKLSCRGTGLVPFRIRFFLLYYFTTGQLKILW